MSEQNIEGMKRNIEAQLSEYEQAIANAKAWYSGWQERQRAKGFRCTQDQPAPKRES